MRPRRPPEPPEGSELRVGRRTLERRGPEGRWRDVRGFGLLIGMLLLATVLAVWALSRLLGPAIGLGPTAAGVDPQGRPLMVDVPVDNVLARLPDGRDARGSFWLRMRQDAAPGPLIELARGTRPTPTPEPGPRAPGPITGTSPEARVREAVNNAMSELSYEQIAGEAGKDRLKSTIRDAVNAALPEAPVEHVYLKEIIVR